MVASLPFCVELQHITTPHFLTRHVAIHNKQNKSYSTLTEINQKKNNDFDFHCREARLKGSMRTSYSSNQAGMWMDMETYDTLLQTCSNMKALPHGQQLHAHMFRHGNGNNVNNIESKLLLMYTQCASLTYARRVFDKMADRNLLSWTAMIAAYAKYGKPKEALNLFHEMQFEGEGLKADSFIFPSLVKACTALQALQQGKEIHGFIIRNGFQSDIYVGSALVFMYVKFRFPELARQVFDKMSHRNELTWNAMIAGYAQNQCSIKALELFREMQFAGVRSDSFTFGSALAACADLAALGSGKEVHGYMIRTRLELDVFVESALVDVYAKCQIIENARLVFDKMSQRDVVSWNAMIAGYAQNGKSNEALKLFQEMQLAGMKPDLYTVLSIIPVCARLTALQQGRQIHNFVIRIGFDSQLLVGNSMIHMYARCGSILAAHQVFDRMSRRDEISWNAIITGYGMHGLGEDAIKRFCQMQKAGFKPDKITFVGLLSACSRAGLVNEGWYYFERMTEYYEITPSMEHYACMVDLLGRAGHLDEAQNFIKKMPLEPDACVWGALLGSCRIHHNIKVAEQAAECLFKLEPENTGNYALLSNIYAKAGRWNDAAKIRNMMKDRGLKKVTGCSWVEVKHRVHSFRGGGGTHPQMEQIYATLHSLAEQIKAAGYEPDINFALHDVENKEKEHSLLDHSEKLALAFGLINTCNGTPLRIIKNLRVCGDCHTAIKFISKAVNREIFLRDTNRFHHFKDGRCSCGDYW